MLAVRKVRGLLVGYAVILLLAGWPLLSLLIADGIATWKGCTLHEGFVNPCIVNGRDVGATLYSMAMMAWFLIATIPLGLVGLVLWTLIWFFWGKWRQNRAAAVPEGTGPAAPTG